MAASQNLLHLAIVVVVAAQVLHHAFVWSTCFRSHVRRVALRSKDTKCEGWKAFELQVTRMAAILENSQ